MWYVKVIAISIYSLYAWYKESQYYKICKLDKKFLKKIIKSISEVMIYYKNKKKQEI